MGLLDKESKQFDEFIEKEFKKTLKIVKPIFKKNNWSKPRDWNQVYLWHYHKYKSMEGYKYPDIKDDKIILEWAEETQGKPDNILSAKVENDNEFNDLLKSISENLNYDIKPKIPGIKVFAKETFLKRDNKINKESQPIEFENKFNQMPIEEVRSHFKPLIEINNPKGIIWMTKEDFEIFIRKSFGEDESLEKPKINLGHGAKMALIKLFYQFYDKCQNEYLTQDRKKDPFLDLLKNAFNTDIFNNLDKSNFKSKKSMKYIWKR